MRNRDLIAAVLPLHYQRICEAVQTCQTAPDGLEKVECYLDAEADPGASAAGVLAGAFVWKLSSEGHDYWRCLYDRAQAMEPRSIGCDCFQGYRGMDRCARCDGTGSRLIVVLGRWNRTFPNTKKGYERALAYVAREGCAGRMS